MGSTNHRIFPRHILGNSSLLICAAGAGEIIDISRSGLAFTPLTFRNWQKKPFQIDLILNTPETNILDINCTPVYPEGTDDNSSPSRYAITFHSLTPEQEEHLETFCAQR